MEPQVVTLEPMILGGISLRTSAAQMGTPEAGGIPAMWQRFRAENVPAKFSRRTDDERAFGVMYDYGANDSFSVLAGVRLIDDTDFPEGFERVEVPAAKYLAFESEKGPLHEVMPKVWTDAHAYLAEHPEYQPAGTFDLESYVMRQADEGPATVYIALMG